MSRNKREALRHDRVNKHWLRKTNILGDKGKRTIQQCFAEFARGKLLQNRELFHSNYLIV